MKKLFVMFLLVALVPFTVGCGLFDYDDPDPIATTTLTKTVKVPASVVAAANARAAKISYTKLKLYIDGITFTVTGTPTYDEATGLWNVSFSASVVSSIATALKGKTGVAIKLVDTTSGTDVTLAEAVVTYGTTVTGDTLTVNDDGTGKIVITGTAITVTTNTQTTPPTITYFNATAAIGENALTTAETVPAATNAAWDAVYATTDLTPTVRVTFKKGNPAANVNYALPTGVTALADVRWVIFVKNVTTGATFTLNSTTTADKALFTVAAVTGNDAAVDVTFVSTTTKSLDANSKYQVTILDTNLTTATGDVLDVDNFLFKTAANAQ